MDKQNLRILLTAMALSLAVVIVIIIKNFNFIKNVSIKSAKSILSTIGKKPSNTGTVKRSLDIKRIIANVKPSPKLVDNSKQITIAAAEIDKKTEAVANSIMDTIQTEADVRSKQGEHLAVTDIEAAKRAEVLYQQQASQYYLDIIKKIEEEKMKMSVLMAGIRTETQRIKEIQSKLV